MAEKSVEREVRIAGQSFLLRSGDVKRALQHLDPEPIASHFVVVGNRRFPPKQVISVLTGLDRADFTTHHARRTLMRLGFPAGRRGARARPAVRGQRVAWMGAGGASAGEDERLADRLRPLVGQWVAIKDDDVLHAAGTPRQLVGWLNEHGQKADSVFRVPEDELAATGLAPL